MKSLFDGFSKEDKKRMLEIDVESRNLKKKKKAEHKNNKSVNISYHLATKKEGSVINFVSIR